VLVEVAIIDEGEPNDTLAAATLLLLAEAPAGSGYFVGRGLGSLEPSSDGDWWRFAALAGDLVSIAVDTPASDLDPYVYLYNATGGQLSYDHDGGPSSDAFLSCYTIAGSGTYYVLVRSQAGNTGSYEVRVELARGIGLESDVNYSNDSVAGANLLAWTTVLTHRTTTVGATVMAPASPNYPDYGNIDEDYFSLGSVQAGETVFLNLQLPQTSMLQPVIEIRDGTGAIMSVAPNPSETAARVDITTSGIYYAVVVGISGQGTHGQYLLDAAIWPTGALEFADLVPSNVGVPATASSGQTVGFTWDVGNYGTGVTDTSAWYDRVALSSNDLYGDGDDIYLGSVRHDGASAHRALAGRRRESGSTCRAPGWRGRQRGCDGVSLRVFARRRSNLDLARCQRRRPAHLEHHGFGPAAISGSRDRARCGGQSQRSLDPHVCRGQRRPPAGSAQCPIR